MNNPVFSESMGKGRGQGQGRGQRSNQSRGGRGRMGGSGMGAGGNCICSGCGKTVPHERGTPCISIQCPDCGMNMTRER